MTASQPRLTPPCPASEPDLEATDQLLLHLRQQIDLDTLDLTSPDLFPAIITGLGDPRPAMRMSLIELLGEIGDAATPTLCEALSQHPSPVVRQSCAKALMQIADPQGVPSLAQALTQDADAEVRGAAVGALAHLGPTSVAPLLAILAAPNQPDMLQGQVSWAIATAGREAPELIYAQLQSPSPVVRAAVMGAIAKLLQAQPNETVMPQLLQALQDPVASVCCAGIQALVQLKHGPAIALLQQILTSHPQPEVRQAATLGLMQLGDNTAIPLLRQQLDTETVPELRSSLALALAQLQKPPGDAVI